MARPARITDADAKALRRLSGVDPRLKDIDTTLPTKADMTYVDTGLATKANTTYVDTGLAAKANTTYVDTGLAAKANTTYVDTGLAAKADTTYVDGVSSVQTQPLNGSVHGTQALETYRDHAGFVWMSGYLNVASGIAKGTVVARVQSPYRPLKTEWVVIPAGSHYSAVAAIETGTGDVKLMDWSSETGTPNVIRFGGIQWKVA